MVSFLPNYIVKDTKRIVNPLPSGWVGAIPTFGTISDRIL